MSNAQQVKTCCAAAYSSDAATMLLGDSFHPGGAALTRRLLHRLNLQPGQRVADIASGPGTTACLIADGYDVRVDGVDLAAPVVERARALADRCGLAGRVSFHVGDAEALPLADNSMDAAVSECAFCTFPDKQTAAAELARILRPGGRLGLADVTVADGDLPEELVTLSAWVACVADAQPLSTYCDLLGQAGFDVLRTERHDEALYPLLDHAQARLQLAQMTGGDALRAAGIDAEQVLDFIGVARAAVADGLLGYALMVATLS